MMISGKIWGSGQCFLNLVGHQNHLEFLFKMQILEFFSTPKIGPQNLYFIITSSPGDFWATKGWFKQSQTHQLNTNFHHTTLHAIYFSTIFQTYLPASDIATALLSTDRYSQTHVTIDSLSSEYIKLCIMLWQRNTYQIVSDVI